MIGARYGQRGTRAAHIFTLESGCAHMILETEGVVKKFGGLTAVNKVSIRVERGRIFGLIGPNGAGKTTFLNCIAGVHKPEGGTIRFKGEDITGLRSDRICRRGIARTFQICQLFAKMNVIDTVLVASTFGNHTGAKDRRVWAREVLEFVEFPLPEDTPAANLNTGQLKRLDLARALASNPELMLMDEPGAGLTPAELVEFMRLVRKIRDKGITIIVVEHLMKVIMGICDEMAVIQYGKMIAEGTPKEIAENEKVIEAYLGEKYRARS